MPPLRFKAVCTETGREYHLPDLYLSYTPSIGGKGGLCWGLFHEEIDGFKFEAMPEVCQSTGLTDSRGAEVFEGDVLYDIYAFEIGDEDIIGNMRIIEFDGIGFDFFCYFDSSRDDGYKDFHRYLSHHVVIGNRWQPAEDLKARAEAVSNG